MASVGLGMGRGFARGLGASRGGTYKAQPKNSARRSGCQRPQGRRDGCAIALVGPGDVDSSRLVIGEGFVTCGRRDGCPIALVGAWGCGLCRTRNRVRLCDVPLGTRGEVV